MSLRHAFVALALAAVGVASAAPVQAQFLGIADAPDLKVGPTAAAQTPPVMLAQQVQAQQVQMPTPAQRRPYFQRESRPSWIYAVHAVTAAMQGLDAHSTFAAIQAGGVEANPVVRGFAHNRGAFTAMKMGVAAGVIYATDGLAKRHPIRALIVATAINSAYAIVAANNYNVARGLR